MYIVYKAERNKIGGKAVTWLNRAQWTSIEKICISNCFLIEFLISCGRKSC